MSAIDDARAALAAYDEPHAAWAHPPRNFEVARALRALISEHERLTAPTIPYETEEGVVIAVDLDGTVHRARPAPGKAQE
jgi:hypothetical protein